MYWFLLKVWVWGGCFVFISVSSVGPKRGKRRGVMDGGEQMG